MYEKYLILTRGHYYFILGRAMNTLAILFWKQNVSPSDYIFGFNALGNSFHLETVYLLEIGYCSFTFWNGSSFFGLLDYLGYSFSSPFAFLIS